MINTESVNQRISSSQAFIQEILAEANIEINGSKPWDILVKDPRFYQRVIRNPSLGAGESYMDGWWDSPALDQFFYRLLSAEVTEKLKDWRWALYYLKNYLFNKQSIKRSLEVAKIHYDLDNDLYTKMLGPSMAYTCAYWKDAKNLDEAQANKYNLVCQKLNLQASDLVLELGCGWGGFAYFAAKNYGCKIISVNISKQQVSFAKQLCADLPVEIHLCDYRERSMYNPKGLSFDKVVSIGMCEHVGIKNYSTFMQIVSEQLKTKGLFLLHTIGNNRTYPYVDPWINKYIFPNGVLPSIRHLAPPIEKFFVMEDWHNFGADYDKTLMAWYENFLQHWPELSLRYDSIFYRMWVYYLLSCAGMFRARDAQLWQIVLSKGRGQGGYARIS